MKNGIVKDLWIIVKGIFGAAISFAGLLIGLPGLILQLIGGGMVGAGQKLAGIDSAEVADKNVQETETA